MLVGDDRVHLWAIQDHLMVRPAHELAGLIEIRGLGIRRCDFADEAIVGLVVDLAAEDAERLPPPEALLTQISGIKIPRIPVGIGYRRIPTRGRCTDHDCEFIIFAIFRRLFEGNW